MDTETRARCRLSIEQIEAIMKNLKRFSFNGFNIRVMQCDDGPWVVFADVCRTLGYKNPNHESKRIFPEDKRKLEIGLRNTLAVCVNKRGLYSFILFAGKENVEEFWTWAKNTIFDS